MQTFWRSAVTKKEIEQRNLFGICPFMTAQEFLSRKWTIPILRELTDNTKRFSELQKKFGITRTTLMQRLKILEYEGLVHREVFPEVPPRVEYSLTEIGKSFKPVLDSIEIWGNLYIEFLKNRNKNFLETKNDFTN